jgi:hypothetical protein
MNASPSLSEQIQQIKLRSRRMTVNTFTLKASSTKFLMVEDNRFGVSWMKVVLG